MSADNKRPQWQALLLSLVLTGALAALAYYAWIYTNIGVRQLPRGSGFFALLKDLRFFAGLLAVFVVLTFADRIFSYAAGKLKNTD
ncbi:hypothetical protein [Labrenzia sp. PHM005]|uniref:hypothetical protein n=1 Tax=Labrenzia sp. PHM005 TaxID=2590016 RepID=UPI0011408295|nr:hypothetical protein [Labrenzia sp. PHM005]QDG77395.1 hypothetical protein FJ695_16785 [Labrenzia sp. PHM005]